MSEDRVLAALHALRDADEEREASAELEARLVRAFRQRKQRVWRWAGMGIAAGIVGLVGLTVAERPAQREPGVATAVPVESRTPPAVVVSPKPEQLFPEKAFPEKSVPEKPRPAKPRQVRQKGAPPLQEIVTQFYPLMDTPPPFERGELVRVSLPASALRRAGFEVEGAEPDDKIEVEVLMGEEGLARAIRFVSYQK